MRTLARYAVSSGAASAVLAGCTDEFTCTSLPYQPDFGVLCGAYSVQHDRQGMLDGVTETVIHEVAESMSDSRFAGRHDKDGFEIADKCQQHAAKALFDGRAFAIRPLWSNRSGSCRYRASSGRLKASLALVEDAEHNR